MLREFLWWSTAPEGGQRLELDPEAMTKQERLSRMLHVQKEYTPLPTSGPLFEHFIVVGLPTPTAQRPEILYSYPPSNPVSIPGLADFCFPSGILSKKLRKTKSNSSLLQVVYSQSYHHEPENAYVFLLTTAEREFLYGVCVIKHESVYNKPSFFPRDGQLPPVADGSDVVAPRCYCFVSRFPFFKLHFETIYSILDLEYMASVSDLQSLPASLGSTRESQSPPALAHSQSMPALVAPPPEKRKKKIRLRSRSNGLDTNDSNSSAAQDQSPFPGIPLHTVHKMPDQPPEKTIVEKGRERQSSDASSTTTTEVSPDVANLNREQASIRERSGSSPIIEEEAGVSHSVAMPSVGDEADESSDYDAVDGRGRESGSEDSECPSTSSPKKRSDWKREALTGRGIVHGLSEKGKEKEEEKESEKKQNPVIKVLHEYLALPIPRPNHTATFFVHKGLQTLRFHRPAFQDKEHLLADYCLPLTFHLLSTDNLLTFITACLLEKRIVVYSSHVRFLSAVVLSVMPLLRPFEYHSVHIPIVPDSLVDLLDAPVPFIVGLTSAPSKQNYSKDNKEFVVVDLDNDKITTKDTLCQLPQLKELRKKLKPLLKVVSAGRQSGKVPFAPTEEQMSCCHGASLILQTYFSTLFANFRTYCLCDRTDSEKPITVFLKDSFLNDQPRVSRPFLIRFLETRIFFQYCDQRLRQIDAPPTTFPTF